ncbi:MAG: PorP/SprF family type IX secretion system membrane protein [Salinivirgaceae bacterium]|jgi:type IX secretion system PorP/SprF family membrane protein
MPNKFTLVALFFVLSINIFGQITNYSSLNMFNQMYYNPGYAGDGNDIEAKILVRNQWMGFPGQPNTQTFNIDAPFKLFNQQHGAGLSIINDKIGNYSNVGLNISYAYRRSLVQGNLGIGIGLNMTSSGLDGTWVKNEETDPSIPELGGNKPFIFDLNLGVFYRADNLYLSISSMNLSQTRIKYIEEGTGNTASNTSFFGRSVYISTGYDYQLANPLFSIQPGAFIASDFASTQLSISSLITYNKRFFGGLSYKVTDAFIFIAGVDLPSGIQVAVSYDINTSRIIKSSFGSFEFMVGYKFNLDMDKDNRKFKSVRFL